VDPLDANAKGSKRPGQARAHLRPGGLDPGDYVFGKEPKEGAEYRYVRRVPRPEQTWG